MAPQVALETPDGTFFDRLCAIIVGGTPDSTPPQSPLSGTEIFGQNQQWFIGSQISGNGLIVQMDEIILYHSCPN